MKLRRLFAGILVTSPLLVLISTPAYANPECPGTNLCIANTIDGGGGAASSNRFVGVVFLSSNLLP